MKIINLRKIGDNEIDNIIDECNNLQQFIDSLSKDNILESKDEVLSKLDNLANSIIQSKTKFQKEKNEILEQLKELNSFYTTKYLVVGFD